MPIDLLYKTTIDHQVFDAITQSQISYLYKCSEEAVNNHKFRCPSCKRQVTIQHGVERCASNRKFNCPSCRRQVSHAHNVQRCANLKYQKAIWTIKQLEKAAADLKQHQPRLPAQEVIDVSQRLIRDSKRIQQAHPDVLRQQDDN